MSARPARPPSTPPTIAPTLASLLPLLDAGAVAATGAAGGGTVSPSLLLMLASATLFRLKPARNSS